MGGIVREIQKKWKPRAKNSHKGNFGRVFILAGSRGLSGAAYLCGFSALKSGAGLVTLGVPESIYQATARRAAELMVKPFLSNRAGSFSLKSLKKILEFSRNQTVLGIGPGLSQNPDTQKMIRCFCSLTFQPIVLDADGLNAFSGHLSELKGLQERVILTPHMGEFKRLFPSDKGEDVSRISKQFGATIVLKGHPTVVASPDGKTYINKTGNAGMATAGTGDVLTGVICALIGQGFSLFDAARFGVYAHGLAGDLAVKKYGEVGLVASNLVDYLPFAFKRVLKR